MTTPTPPRPTPGRPAGSQLSRWVTTHKAQAAAIAGVAAVAAYALYRKHQAAAAGSAAGAAPAGAQNNGALAPYYDPTTGQYIDPSSGDVLGAPTLTGYAGGSPDTAGGMPAGPDPATAAQLANIQAQLAALGAAQNGTPPAGSYGAPATGPIVQAGAPPTAVAKASPSVHPPLYYGMASTPAQARAMDPNIGASSAADAAYLAGGSAAVQKRIGQIASNRGITLNAAQLGALANRALAPAGSSGYLSLDQIRSQIDRGGSAY